MKSTSFDVAIVGSGFGGSATALACVRAGLRTVVVERGGWAARDDDDWSARRILLDHRYRDEAGFESVLYGEDRTRVEHANAVVGGNSIFYGGAALRLRETDFSRWPITYDELSPYYDEAEAILGVHGAEGADPFEPPRGGPYPHRPIDYTAPAQRIVRASESLGYRPFPLPLAINFTDEREPLCIRCTTCDGFPCKLEAKNDAARTFLRLGMAEGLTLLANTRVHEILLSGDRATGLVCVDRSSLDRVELTADTIVVAAGAIESPSLLTRSGLGSHPAIGRYLMRHCNAIVSCLFPFQTNPDRTFHKQVCVADFYEDFRDRDGTAVGVIQDIYTPTPEVMKHHAPKWGKWVIDLTHRHLQNLLCVAEDEPRAENAVELTNRPGADGMPAIRVTHDYTPADYARNRLLTDRAAAILKAAGGHLAYRHRLDTFSHALGTVRMSDSAEEGPIDRSGRLRAANNVYVTDGSVFPTSAGLNPSLTIAANALRVGEGIARG
jgi:choline dehydrogenase-like flavoprotein